MKILLVDEFCNPIDQRLYRELGRRGVSLGMVSDDRDDVKALCSEAGIEWLGDIRARGRLDLPVIRTVRNAIRRFQPDLMQMSSPRALSNGMLAARPFPQIGTIGRRGVRGGISIFNPGDWLSYLNPRLDRIVCISHSVRQSQLDYRPFRFLYGSKRPAHITYGLSEHATGPKVERDEGRRRYAIPPDAFVVGSLCTIRPYKNLSVVARAIKEIPPEEKVHLAVIGPGASPADLDELRTTGLGDRLHLIGYHQIGWELLPMFDLFAMPTRYPGEGLGKALGEAMKCGLACLVSNTGAASELIDPGRSGYSLPYDDWRPWKARILDLRHDPERCARMGQAAAERIDQIGDFANCVDLHMMMYEDVLREKRGEA